MAEHIKIYCGECAYLLSGDYSECCKSPHNYDTVSNWRGVHKDYFHRPEDRNANNDCPHFKLVWYKRLFKRLRKTK
jgi:hypothetical protein